MSGDDELPAGRAEFHQRHKAQAILDAERLIAHRAQLKDGWLAWVAGELYRLGPPPYVAMVRRELQRLTQD